jgi:hypothetical protein
MLPIEESLIGTRVKILGTRIKDITAVFGITVSEEDDTVLQKSRVSVRNVDNSSTVSVIQDIVSNPAFAGTTTNIDIEIERFIYSYQSDGLRWNNTGVIRVTV